MNALTYDLRNAAATAKVEAPKEGFWTRLLNAMIEARMRQAEREIALHIRHVPENVLAQAGLKATYKDAAKLPFVK